MGCLLSTLAKAGVVRDKCQDRLNALVEGMGKLLVVAVVIAVVVLLFSVPLVPSTMETNVALPCALRGGPCYLLYPTGLVTFHLYASLSYASFHIGIVYSPDPGGGVWFVGWDAGLVTLGIVVVAALALYVYFHYWHRILDSSTHS